MENQALIALLQDAKEAARQAYAPYSGFCVGAALLATDGSKYLGCNVENASYSLTICAERNALFGAVSEGQREFDAIAIWVDADQVFPPCGACRQALYEFSPSLKVIYGNDTQHFITDLASLLPGAFGIEEK